MTNTDPTAPGYMMFAALLDNPQEKRQNKKWPFKRMKPGQYQHFPTYIEYARALNACRQVERRKGYKFTYKWDESAGGGVIGRVE